MKLSLKKFFIKNNRLPLQRTVSKNSTIPEFEEQTDKFVLNIKKSINYKDNGEIFSIYYDLPIQLIKAIMDVKSDNVICKELQKSKINPKLELQKLEQEILKSKELEDIKIKSLLGYGYKTLVFETGGGKVLKITRGDHFNGRKPADFDLPIYKSGKITDDGEFYYYIEDKIFQENLDINEVKKLTDYIKRSGYRLKDYKEEGLPFGEINLSQFGKTNDGRIYLIDPECAQKINPNESIFTRIYRKFFG